MIARFHYDREICRQFLNDELAPPDERDVETHVEKCEDCQKTLESVSQDQVSWDAIPRLLTPDAMPAPNSPLKAHPNFLTESDYPNSLGRFGRFEIVEHLGTGGMGIVLKGYDPALNRYSAIKVLAPVLATSSSARNRFAREAKSAAAVVHEHVVPIQTVDEENGLPYFVMPVVDGQSLQQRVDAMGPLEIKEVLRIGMQIASGLAAAHAQGLVHRDVKPANALLENGVERVMLMDFGLARAADEANMTQSGVITGTPQYMSPEQAQGLVVDQQSDLFSLGSVLYFMCTGHSPFRAKTTFGVLNRIISDEHRPVRDANADVPEWLQCIVDRLLSKDKALRYGTAGEVAEILSQWLAHLQQPEVVDKPSAPKATAKSFGKGKGYARKRVVAAAAGAFLLLFAGFFISIEMGKGTLTIECTNDSVPVRIMKGDKVERRLTIDRGATSTRISAGSYVVEIDGPSDSLEVKQGTIVLSRGGAAVARIVEKFEQAKNETDGHNADDNSVGATKVEFLEGTDVVIVRGKEKNVKRLMGLIDQSTNTYADSKMRTQSVQRGSISIPLAARGTLKSDRTVDIRSEVSGNVQIIKLAPHGQTVRKGDLIIELDSSKFQDQVSDLTVMVAMARAKLKRSESRRASLSDEDKDKSEGKREELEADVAAAQTAVDISIQSLAKARKQLEMCRIYSPTDGIVVHSQVSGRTKLKTAEGSFVRNRQHIARVVDPTRLHANVKVSALWAAALKQGQVVDIRIDAFPEKVLQGKVQHVSEKANPVQWFSAGVRENDVLIAFDTPAFAQKPGLTVTVEFPPIVLHDAIRIPMQAIQREGSRAFCLVRGAAGLERREVIVGLSNNEFAEVKDGLTEGEEIVLNP